jgi:glycosyltransferase involved in cell wall biosynthesis
VLSINNGSVRLGVYSDLLYQSDRGVISTDEAFIKFILPLREHLDGLVIFGRLSPTAGRAPYVVPSEQAQFVALPSYPSTADVIGVLRALRQSVATFARQTPALDAVWLFGPHPLSLLFALVGRRRGVRVFLGVRQDFPRYIAERLPSRRWLWALPIAHALEWAFRLASRRCPTVVVGEDLARRYAAGRPPLTSVVSLVTADDLASADEATDWPDDEIRVLTVGRLDPEKNPLLLADILARLRERDSRWKFIVVGEGPLADPLRRRATDLGVGDGLELRGYVPNGPQLRECYRSSQLFLHVTLTEGMPQVVLEAQAARLPIVATDVGSVSTALAHGQAGLLVQPQDADAAAAALHRLAGDPTLRHRLADTGLAHARRHTREAELQRVAGFIGAR